MNTCEYPQILKKFMVIHLAGTHINNKIDIYLAERVACPLASIKALQRFIGRKLMIKHMSFTL